MCTSLARQLRPFAIVIAVAAAVIAGLPAGATRAADYYPQYGSTAAASGELLRGCHQYTYTYALTPPEGDWALETFITGPQGESVASGAFLEGADQVSGTGTFQLCFPTSHSGTFTLNAKLTVDGEGSPNHFEGFLPPTTFTLIKQKRSHHKTYTLGPIRVRR